MRYPLDSITITGAFKEVAQPGTGLPDSSGVKRHIGVDLRAAIGTKVYAVGSGTVTMSYYGAAGQTIEIRIGDKLWRFMHLSRRDVAVGDKVTEGQVIGLSGNSGGVAAHLHVDVRKDGTTYNASLNNYFDPLALIKGDNVTQTEAEAFVRAGFKHLFKREADPGGLANYVGHALKGSFDFIFKDWASSAEFKAVNTINNTVTVEKPVPYEVEKIVEVRVEVPRDVIVEKIVEVEKPVPPVDLSIGQLFEALVNKILRR